MIICKGTKNNGKIEKCGFVFNGDWGDEKLVEHQQRHISLEHKSYFWLGFDTSQILGNFSGRDGKRA